MSNEQEMEVLQSDDGNCVWGRSLLWAGVQPTLDPSVETIHRSNALAQQKRGELAGVCECVCDVQGRKVK